MSLPERKGEHREVIDRMWEKRWGIASAEELGVDKSVMKALRKQGVVVFHTDLSRHHPVRRREILYQLREFHDLGKQEIRENAIRREANRLRLLDAHRAEEAA